MGLAVGCVERLQNGAKFEIIRTFTIRIHSYYLPQSVLIVGVDFFFDHRAKLIEQCPLMLASSAH